MCQAIQTVLRFTSIREWCGSVSIITIPRASQTYLTHRAICGTLEDLAAGDEHVVRYQIDDSLTGDGPGPDIFVTESASGEQRQVRIRHCGYMAFAQYLYDSLL